MKGKLFKKALAVATSVLMLSGGVPIQPLSQVFEDIAITASAEGEVNLSTLGSYTAQDGDVLTGSTTGTVTIADNASITLNDVTITGGIVCNGTATITLVGTNIVNVSNDNLEYKKAGIQIGGSGTTLTIRGNGSLTATGGSAAAGIGLGRTWDASVTAGSIVIEGGTVTASGGIGIGIGTVGNSQTAAIDGISIKGGTVNASLGKGYLYYGVTATVGYIKVYDTIDMVDASKITETVTYMHGDDDVTANKTDYFTIGEDGERRIITPKDDTDYTITIADGIENGTITAAATAKYLETVTVTATPTFGYRLSRLIVKDADNNDIATNGNTFLMPKGNVTVSAEFALGSHGTTEFTWGYDSPGSFVNEATIYDGVTTVNIQQTGAPYSIRKYDGYTYSKFQLDNDNYDANIPYDGGTGEFYETGNGTNFRLPYDGETGYYDITMTDVGNGKWSVSILKTAAIIADIPDQTYTGGAITPEPLVVAGSLDLTKGTDYEYSYSDNTNVGTATVTVTFKGDYASLGSVEKTFNILPSTIMVSVTGNGTVTYNDKSAANGETIGVTAEKGTDVTLTLTPENGYAVRSVEYGYTNSNEMTMNGAKLPINGTTATLTVPNDLKDGTYVNLTVTFVSALAGGADEASAVALTDNTVTNFAGGWYKVDSDITFDHTLNLLGDTHLIIDDGKTMTVNTASGKAIDSEYTLNVSGEGALNITTTEAYKIAVRVGSYVQTGATVTASGYIGIRCTDDFIAFNFDNDFTFSGGQLTATGSGGDGIWADNDITLSCTNATDFIQASSYSSAFGAVKIAEGNALTDGTNTYSGTLTNEQRTAIGGKTLQLVATMDNIPDQTYTGSAITPEPIVIAGSLNLTKGTDYTYSYTNNTKVGTAKVIVTFKGNYASLGSVEKEFNIVRATPTVTAPTANTLTYNGNEQELVTAGSTDFGTLLYSLDGETYSEEVPKGTSAGDYTVYYKVEGSDNWNAVEPQTVKVTIAESYTITWKNGDETLETDNYVPGGATPEYNGETPTKSAYTFSGWSDGTNTYAPNALPAVSGDVTYTAQFSETVNKYNVTLPENMEISNGITLTDGKADYGTEISFKVKDGYAASNVKANGTDLTATDGVYTVSVEGDTEITADIKKVYADGIGEHLAGHSLSLNGNIGVNFYMELDADVIADPDAYMLFTLPNDTTQTVKVSDATVDTTTVSGKTYYVFQCSVAAKEMTDTIKAQMFSGEKQGEEYSYTVKQYADYLFANAYEADGSTVKNQAYVDAIELIKSMVNYGAYSQLYFNHNIDSLANADITDTDVSGVTAETVNKTYDGSTNTLPDGVTLARANLELESETVMNLYFTNTTGKTLTFTTSGNVALVQEQSGKYTKVTITGIAAQYLDSDVTVDVALEGDDNAYSVKYSPMNYCYNVLARETTATRTEALKDVMRAFYLYNKEAKAYFASHNN